MEQDVPRGAAEDQPRQSGAPARAHHDGRDVVARREAHDLGRRVALQLERGRVEAGVGETVGLGGGLAPDLRSGLVRGLVYDSRVWS